MTTTWHKLPKMSRSEWLEWRRGGIGASDAPSIMGVSPWSTPYQTWEKKVAPAHEIDNSSMKRGRDLEGPARAEFENQIGVSVFAENTESVLNPWLKASLDGICQENKVLVEIKCPNRIDHQTALDKKVPEKYYPQCQHQMAVTGLPGMYYFSYDGSKGVIVEVPRDDAYINGQLFPKLKQFWEGVVNLVPPEMTEKDRVLMEENQEWREVCGKWKETNRSLREVQQHEKSLKEQLIALSNNRNAIGSGVSLSKSICRGGVDYLSAIDDYLSRLKLLYPTVDFPSLDVEKYRKAPIIKWTPRAI